MRPPPGRDVLGLWPPRRCGARPSGWVAPRAPAPMRLEIAQTCKVKQSPAARKDPCPLPAPAENSKNKIFLAGVQPLNAKTWATCSGLAGFLSLPHVGSSTWSALTSHSSPSGGCAQTPGALPLHYLLTTLLVRPGNEYLRDSLVSPAARPPPVLGLASGSASA